MHILVAMLIYSERIYHAFVGKHVVIMALLFSSIISIAIAELFPDSILQSTQENCLICSQTGLVSQEKLFL